ncbi:hypothetical protein LMG24238_07616 [Paraburkholderia sediminicola]|uniref:BON domain-containing protein n=1 Tax=Paraburkholderia sediminicola TaxID=458836 RepID=A0A6J5CWF8_9BURK|nr:BON domain-containing protein [Paraburkholderia sediminicola]CAB3745480.1 hypothetical protein LMG24238_07616 [Paraburkholderia sediminicola]
MISKQYTVSICFAIALPTMFATNSALAESAAASPPPTAPTKQSPTGPARQYPGATSHIPKTPPGAKGKRSEIHARVIAALHGTQGIDVENIQVRSFGGAVTLNGTVPSQIEMNKAGEVAAEVSGVTSVKNKLTIRESGDDTGAKN